MYKFSYDRSYLNGYSTDIMNNIFKLRENMYNLLNFHIFHTANSGNKCLLISVKQLLVPVDLAKYLFRILGVSDLGLLVTEIVIFHLTVPYLCEAYVYIKMYCKSLKCNLLTLVLVSCLNCVIFYCCYCFCCLNFI